MTTKDFYYDLPQELIAQTPLTDRTASRLLVLDRQSGEVEHKHFYDILSYLSAFASILGSAEYTASIAFPNNIISAFREKRLRPFKGKVKPLPRKTEIEEHQCRAYDEIIKGI